MIADYKPRGAMHSTCLVRPVFLEIVNYFVEQIILLPEIILLLSRKKLSHLIWKLINSCIFFYARIVHTNLHEYYNSQCNNYQFSYSNTVLLLVRRKRRKFYCFFITYYVALRNYNYIRNEDNYYVKVQFIIIVRI